MAEFIKRKLEDEIKKWTPFRWDTPEEKRAKFEFVRKAERYVGEVTSQAIKEAKTGNNRAFKGNIGSHRCSGTACRQVKSILRGGINTGKWNREGW